MIQIFFNICSNNWITFLRIKNINPYNKFVSLSVFIYKKVEINLYF